MLQLCQNIRQARINKGLSQQKVADLLGESRSTYKNWEESTEPELSKIKTIANILEVSFDELVNGTVEAKSFIEKRRGNKLLPKQQEEIIQNEGVPIYDVPIDASFLERVHDSKYFEPMYFINIPKLRNCNFGAIVSGSSMYPIMKSGSIAMCRLVEDLNYFDPGEMYLLATTNGFETVKYVQQGEEPDELLLIPHNDKIRPTTIKKSMIIRMCIVEAWLNFR